MIRLITAGYCKFSELKDGTYDMEDVQIMNSWLDLNNYVEACCLENARNKQRD